MTGRFPIGPRGAGRSATVGKGFGMARSEPAGQGGAFRQAGATKVAVFSVVNALGAIVDRSGAIVRGHLDRATGKRFSFAEEIDRRITKGVPARPSRGNTTLTVVVTNQKLAAFPLGQIARQVHSSMGRALQPFHAIDDGDVLFAVTTGESEDRSLDSTALGVIASELAWDAVLSCFAGDRPNGK